MKSSNCQITPGFGITVLTLTYITLTRQSIPCIIRTCDEWDIHIFINDTNYSIENISMYRYAIHITCIYNFQSLKWNDSPNRHRNNTDFENTHIFWYIHQANCKWKCHVYRIRYRTICNAIFLFLSTDVSHLRVRAILQSHLLARWSVYHLSSVTTGNEEQQQHWKTLHITDVCRAQSTYEVTQLPLRTSVNNL